ncbi:aromatic amino acid transport family protein (plasmid) [Photobacterium sp. DA100]|uniref:amino acid permease n=1 Tax=Photobacterium sp. DA100 TaxID=3027472 RepID=UPI0024790E8E|nr:aromatic amino acid transport family protein [Photobacterium sp. DA100]WEM44696.1 aromatic amino acid transport family protein [Photobacterium sp. DA100]
MNIKAVGATLLISGTMLGAGMLALPLISAGMGVKYSILFLSTVWFCMTYSGLMLLEVCLNYQEGTGLEAIAEDLFGKRGKVFINVTLLLLLYSLSCAYISGGSSIYQSNITNYLHISIPSEIVACIFTALIGTIVYISTKAVDIVNRVLFSINIIIFLLLVCTINPYVNKEFITNQRDSVVYSFAAIPVFITAFGFHGSIPSMIKYIGKDNPTTLRNIFIAGGLIPLAVYIVWEVSTLGSLPRFGPHSFEYISSHGSSVAVMLEEMRVYIHNDYILYLISAFSSIAMFTSYLCVSLGLFDSVASNLKKGNSHKRRFITALITYLPPLAFTIIYPDGFVKALGAAAIFLTILAVLFPVLALNKIRGANYQRQYNVMTNKLALFLVGCVGVEVIVSQILTLNDALPVF